MLLKSIITAVFSVAVLAAASHFDDKVRNDFFAGIAGDQAAIFDRLGTHSRSELLFGLADGYARDGNAEKARLYFTKLAALGPQSGHQQQADLYLKGEKYSVTGVGCAGCHTGK